MSVNPSKSRNLVFEKEKFFNENVLSIKVNKNKCSISPISGKSVTLERTISDSLSNQHQVDNLSFSVNKGWALLNQSNHTSVQEL